MAKNFKLKLTNIQLGKTAGLEKLKAKLAGEKSEEEKPSKKEKEAKPKAKMPASAPAPSDEEKPRRIRAKTKSDFAPKEETKEETLSEEKEEQEIQVEPPVEEAPVVSLESSAAAPEKEIVEEEKFPIPYKRKQEKPIQKEKKEEAPRDETKVRLGPTGRHINDLYTPKKEAPKPLESAAKPSPTAKTPSETEKKEDKLRPVKKEGGEEENKAKKVREFKDVRAPRRDAPQFDSRARQGLIEGEEDRWRKRRGMKSSRPQSEEAIIRPTQLKIRLPLTIKELAAEMKLKASELVQKLFMQGMVATLNDVLDDPTMAQYLGAEFGCKIEIDTSEEERIQVTAQSIQEEIQSTSPELLKIRPPIVTFMGHVDHGKTSLIDAIRKTNIASGEAGAITQHIGAFRCKTAVGDITILDTPGHEAFSAMRARGALATDIVVLVVAGDEGIREQTVEAIGHAQAANVTIVVAINKCDKPNFNAETVYRQLAEINLLPESWGGQIITVNTSAQSGQGIQELLEMLALQAEVLDLKANHEARARGTVIESELHKGLGLVARVLVQNGTLRMGDALVIDYLYGRIKTMRDEFGNNLKEAGPSTPVEITGLSGLPKAGDAFIVVKNEKEAKEIAEARAVGIKQKALLQKKAPVMESFLSQENKEAKKVLKIVLRADVQGSLEALKASLQKIDSSKAEVDIIFSGIGEISESDVQLASASNAVIFGFHTQIESHASSVIKELGITVRLHDIIYHAVDDTKKIMQGLLEKIAEEKETGQATVQATFKASQLGMIAGSIVTDGIISRSNLVRVVRENKEVWRGKIASLKRVKEDVKEVKKGIECGILLENFNEVQVGDVIHAYEIVYHTQEL